MTTFRNDNEARNKAVGITGSILIYVTSNGLEINNFDVTKTDVINELKSVFSDVKIVGKKHKQIIITRQKIETNGIRITKVAY